MDGERDLIFLIRPLNRPAEAPASNHDAKRCLDKAGDAIHTLSMTGPHRATRAVFIHQIRLFRIASPITADKSTPLFLFFSHDEKPRPRQRSGRAVPR
uniref:Uncharacterized protein n=1 Tax=Methylocapsa acidiphila TaxID=133552 RepID=Q2VNG7_METAI|nr:hypothetical protein orf137 [Methylocapsa acidiphila]